MQSSTTNHQERKTLTALKGLSHHLPQVRSQYAKYLGHSDGPDALEALKQAYLIESNILCKTEMIRSIVALEEKLGLGRLETVAFEGANP